MFIFLLVTAILSTVQPSIKSDLDVKRLRLKNGATVIYSSMEWNEPSRVVGVFLKNGGTLKFNKKSGFTALTQELVSSRLKKLSREMGFRYRSYLTWDYLAYLIYLPPDVKGDELARIWDAFYGDAKETDTDVNTGKNSVIYSIKRDMEQKVVSFPMISFMVGHRSLYSVGMHGSQEDVGSISTDEIKDFMRCYLNPNNSIIISAAESNIYKLTKGIDPFKPCFRDERFEDEGVANFNSADRSVNYLNSEKKIFIIRLGFPSNSCDRKENIIYDLAAEVLKQDTVISALSGQVKIVNHCYLNRGVLEVALTDVKKDADEITNRLLQRIKFLASNIDVESFNSAREGLDRNFWEAVDDKTSFVHLLGKAQISSGSYENLLDYTKKVKAITVPEIKEILKNISDENMYKMYIKLEG
jgi:predicted Zn-dependent peptidase